MTTLEKNPPYQRNSDIPWEFDKDVPDRVPIFVLAEQYHCNPTEYPKIFRVMYNPDAPIRQAFDVLDYENALDSYISTNEWKIIAWRPMTDHGGTFDDYIRQNGFSPLDNWFETHDEETEEDEETEDENTSLYIPNLWSLLGKIWDDSKEALLLLAFAILALGVHTFGK